MANTICSITDLTVTTIQRGSRYHGAVNAHGDEAVDCQLTLTDEPDDRYYDCQNCGQRFDGTETFAEAKAHLGQFHEHIPAGFAMLKPKTS